MITELEKYKTSDTTKVSTWFKAAAVDAFPENGGACVKYKDPLKRLYSQQVHSM